MEEIKMLKKAPQKKNPSDGQLKQLCSTVIARIKKLGMTNREVQGCILAGPLVTQSIDQMLKQFRDDPRIAEAAIKKTAKSFKGIRFEQCHIYELPDPINHQR